MASRQPAKQSAHDGAVSATGQIYREKGKFAWTNPDGEKNKSWAGYYIDVIALNKKEDTSAWVIEVETDESISESEAKSQWKEYANAYNNWYLAVPKGEESNAQALLKKQKITNCTVISWQKNSNGTHTFWGLPGL